MLNALLIANARSGSAAKARRTGVPGCWRPDPREVTADDVRNADLVAFFAGDGTVQRTLSHLLTSLPPSEVPPIALLPFGTTNMSARGLNRSRRPRDAVASLHRAIRSGVYESGERPLVRVRDGNATAHGFFFGMGVIGEVVERWNRERGAAVSGNQLRTALAMLRGLRSVSSTTEIALNGERRRVYGLLATTLDRLLFGSRPYWGAALPGDLRLTWVEGHARHLLRRAPALLRGSPRMAELAGFESCVLPRISLDLAGPWILDGEIFHAERASLTIDRSDPLRWVIL
ncbi:MAG: diacylglycerol kinase family protein [Pseudomonadales bacterium]